MRFLGLLFAFILVGAVSAQTSRTDLTRAINAALYEVSSTNEFQTLATKWFGVSANLVSSCGPLGNVNSAIVAAVQYPQTPTGVLQQILARKSAYVGYGSAYAPYYYNVTNGNATSWGGFSVDLTDLVLSKIAARYSVSNITQIPVVWSTSIASMFTNEINTVDFAARYTAIRNDRRQRARFTCSYTQITSGLLYHVDSDVNGLNAAGVKFCSYPGTAFNAEISANFPLATLITTYPSSDAAFSAVVSGECNATVNDKYALGALTQANQGSVALDSQYAGTTTDYIGFIVGADDCSACTGMIPETGNAALRLAMNAAQLSITSGEYNTIAAKYGVSTGFSSDCSANAGSFNLNTYPTASGVLADVIAKREVVVATGDAFLPYYTYTNGTLSGFMTEYTQLVFTKIAAAYNVPSISVKFVLETDSSFTFLAKLAVNGSFSTSQRQIYLTTAQDARNQAVIGGCSVYNVQAAVMLRNGVSDPNANGLIFAVWTGSTYSTLTSSAFPNAVVVAYPSTEEALAAVLSGAANATVNDMNYLGSFIIANNASDILTIGQNVGAPSAVTYQFRHDTCPVCRSTTAPVAAPVAAKAPTSGNAAPKTSSATKIGTPTLIASLLLLAVWLL
eukprot:TRINITY_DN140_c0_g2_i1.p1 TRINITY_DN140_c0_g2~~TRINITY_DN140_c0_g2_i1.p1  ORF type:complete len:621 (-),score=139.97 TRINITY_DN140_c0_g2_i1:46-1908(-)